MAKIPKKRRRRQRGKTPLPRTEAQYRALPVRAQETVCKAAHALTEMRGGASLRKAARQANLDPRTVRQLAGAWLRKSTSGRYIATKTDRLLRILVIPTSNGLAEIAIQGSRGATLLAEYWNATQLFLETGDSTALQRFDGVTITNARGERIALLTDLDELERLGSAGVLSFESIYARVA